MELLKMISLRYALAVIGLCCAVLAHGQDVEEIEVPLSHLSVQDSLAYARIKLVRNNMHVRGAWAGANIVQGIISSSNTTGPEKHMHQMNAYWNTANLTIAGMGLLRARQQLKRSYDRELNLKEQYRLEKILLLSVGLDLGYVTTGLYLKERGMRKGNDQTQGYGTSLILQGAFLLALDIIQYGQHRKNTKCQEKFQEQLQVGTTPHGLGLTYRF